ncbi:MAG: S-layer homology domain-containing protein [Clostridia bacterium]|nr:S-layer homology domain-containing protein [Clostridia bacterium]
MRLIKIISAALVFASIGVHVFAEELYAVYSPAGAEVKISGDFGRPRELIMLMLLPEGVSPSELNENDISENKYVTKTLRAGSEGDFSVLLTMPDSAGGDVYTVYAFCGGLCAEAEFSHVNIIEVSGFIGQINSADKIGIESILNTNRKSFGIDAERQAVLGTISEILYTAKPSGGYSVSDFWDELGRASAIALIKDGGDFDSAVRKYGSGFELDTETELIKLSAEQKSVLASIISAEMPYGDTAGYFTGCLLLAWKNTASSYVQLGEKLEKYAQAAGISLEKYNKTGTNKPKVLQKLYETPVSNIESFKDKLDSISSQYIASAEPGSSYGGSGSGGSGSGGGKIQNVATASGEMTKTAEKAADKGLSDMESHWCREYVLRLSERGIISGYEDNTFRPDKNISRAEYVKLITGALGISSGVGADFKDVSAGDWYYECISAGAENGLVTGSDGFFRPEDNITREDAAVILHRAMKLRNAAFDTSETFEDETEISAYAADAVSELASVGIITGYESMFRPKSLATRAEASAMLCRMLDYLN